MKRMLFNATQAEELRVAIVDGQKLIDLDIESANKEQRKSNIYKAVITRIEPSLEAAFVDYGAERHGFLPFKEVSRSFFQPGIEAGRARIQDALKVGQELIVQVEKDERGNKGAALTTYISLAGRYLVLMPNNPRGGGVSRRIEGEDRQELREVMDQLDVPGGMSLIARTAGIGRSAEELQWDLNYLLQLWTAIDGAAKSQSGAFLIYQESSLVIRAIRDYFHPEIGEILIDTDDIFEQAQQFMAHVMPATVSRVKRYRDDVPLFSRFQIEHQIESAYSRQVNLPSGGAVVIDHTEALVAVDVNSGRATKGSDIEETALRTNCEAADEIARQLRLRDLGGLIVIDFIDMESTKNQREVENRLRDALHFDRARVQTGKISRFGLLELSRQRLRPALAETSYITCPRCTGTGHIRSTESAALHILRILEEEAMKENTGALHVQVPVDVGTFLLNEKRVDIARIEMRHRVNLLIIPNRHLETPQHEIIRLRHDQLNLEGIVLASYEMAVKPTEEENSTADAQAEGKAPRAEAAVKGITPDQPAPLAKPAPVAAPAAKPGLFARIISWFSGSDAAEVATPEPTKRPEKSGRGDRNRNERGERNRNDRGDRNRKDGRDNRGDRGDRNERSGSETTDKPEKKDRNPPRDRERQPQQRKERGERNNEGRRDNRGNNGSNNEEAQTAATAAVAETALANAQPASTDANAEGGADGARRRGRRGGRGRGNRNEETANTTDAVTTNVIEAVANETTPASVAVSPAPTLTSPVAETEVSKPMPWPTPAPIVAETALVVVAETKPAPVIEVPVAAPVETVTAPTVAPLAAVAPPPAEPVDLSSELQKAGLQLVETSGSTAPVMVVAPAPTLGRKPKAAVVIPDEPLQLVETQRKD
ncbi:MAG: Rne/Rng family ribonuclease [Rhodocyclaceae bacterium]|nr:Rne/Rng family ribonuclease [Rhodocyclaceae bacterium]MDZ4213318.1 Rne/Rng family ribonuclease [Rhodocyclaceae bacterium]